MRGGVFDDPAPAVEALNVPGPGGRTSFRCDEPPRIEVHARADSVGATDARSICGQARSRTPLSPWNGLHDLELRPCTLCPPAIGGVTDRLPLCGKFIAVLGYRPVPHSRAGWAVEGGGCCIRCRGSVGRDGFGQGVPTAVEERKPCRGLVRPPGDDPVRDDDGTALVHLDGEVAFRAGGKRAVQPRLELRVVHGGGDQLDLIACDEAAVVLAERLDLTAPVTAVHRVEAAHAVESGVAGWARAHGTTVRLPSEVTGASRSGPAGCGTGPSSSPPCRWSRVEREPVGVGPAGSESTMRCLSLTDPELLTWLRSQLRTATVFTAFTTDADEPGLALLAEPLSWLLARDGRIRIVAATARAAAAAGGALAPGGDRLAVDVAPASSNVYVVEDNDGTCRAYLGATQLTFTGLTSAGPGVVLDMRQDADDARSLLAAQTQAADAALAESVSLTRLENLMQPVMDDLASREGRGAQEAAPATSGMNGTGVPGLPTGSRDLDQLTGGLQPGDLWVVTGRSGAGKTMFTLGLARAAAIRSHAPAALMSVRGSDLDTTTMLLSAEARVGLHYLRFGGLGSDDWARLARRMGEIAEAPLLLLSAGAGTAPGPRSAAERIAAARDVAGRHDLALLIVDDPRPRSRPRSFWRSSSSPWTRARASSRSSTRTLTGRLGSSRGQRAWPRTSWCG